MQAMHLPVKVRAPGLRHPVRTKSPVVLRPPGSNPAPLGLKLGAPLRSRQPLIMLKLVSSAQQVERVRPVGHLLLGP